MGLKERLVEDMKAAMKSGEAAKIRLSTIRMVRAAVKNTEIDRRRELSEEEVLDVISKEVKLRREAMVDFERGNRSDLVQQAQAEIEVLSGYLPQQLTESEIRELARTAIQATGATAAKDMGKVMQALMPQTRGRADGRLVSQVVKELLQ